jgi:transcriptional regulator with XRE-family HTH domain
MKQIRIIRQNKGIKQNQLAAMCGLRQATLSNLETGRARNPKMETLERIAKALGVSIGDLLEKSAA